MGFLGLPRRKEPNKSNCRDVELMLSSDSACRDPLEQFPLKDAFVREHKLKALGREERRPVRNCSNGYSGRSKLKHRSGPPDDLMAGTGCPGVKL